MSRVLPGALTRQASANAPPRTMSDTGPARLITIRRRRDSNQASVVSTNT